MWKILLYNGLKTNYIVSCTGEICNSISGKVLHPTLDRYGYLKVCLHIPGKDGKTKQISVTVHRLVAICFIPNDDIKNKTQIDHIDGDKTNNNVDNLEWVTPKENVSRAYALGLRIPRKGEKHPNNIFSETAVRRACELLEENKLTIEKIGKLCGMSRKYVQKIKSGNVWHHVSSQYNIPKPKPVKNLTEFHEFIENMLTSQFIPEIPSSLSPAAPIIPETWVPCPPMSESHLEKFLS